MRDAEIYAKLPVFRRRVEQANQIIADGLKSCAAPYLACSFGKDSAAMLHLVLRQFPAIRVRFMRWANESDLLHDYEKVVNEWLEMFPALNLEIVEMMRASLDDKLKTRWQEFEKDADAYFIGFRAEESKGRLMTIKANGVLYRKKNELLRICPLAFWTVKDVAAYTVENQLPTLSAYKSEGFETRTTARVPRADNGIRAMSLGQLKKRNPAGFNLLCQKFPEVKLYV